MRSTSAARVAATVATRVPPSSAAISPCSAPGTDDGDREAAVAGLPGHLELAVEHDEQRVGGVALADEHLAGLEVDDLAARHELAQRRLVDVGEERRLPQAGDDLVDGEVGVGHSCAR